MNIVRAGMNDHADAYAIVEEYCDAIDVVLRDDYAAVKRYLEDPAGIWLARDGGTTFGCIALLPLESIEGACEVKRLYVRPSHRGRGAAHALLDALHAHARHAGYKWAYLDTKSDLLVAIRFYESRGYRRCERYNANPQATIFMRRGLEAAD